MPSRTAAKLVAVAVGLRVLVVVAKALLDRIRGRGNKYDGLLSIVSYSSRLIAGTISQLPWRPYHTVAL